MASAGIWTEAFPVRSYAVTPHGTASVLAVCDYLQEAAGHHAQALGVSMQDLLREGRAWVLARLRLQVEQLPPWGQEVVVETWPSGLDGLYTTREFVLHAESGEAPMARGTSAWLVIDTDRRRPLRPPRVLHTIETPDRPPPLSPATDDLPVPEQTDCERSFAVRYHDLDLNRHVNNVRYVEWALETLPPGVHDTHRCTDIALQFKAETTLGDTVHATARLEEDGDTLRAHHHLRQSEADRTLGLATTTWEKRADGDA
jgi:acyl-ACP thioesterase